MFTTPTYDLVSHGPDTAGQNECYGDYDTTTQNGWGPVYQNACIHSGSTEHSGGNTVWYNYTIASAGTIIDENTDSEHPATNTAPATESICPKGWTLPNKTQIDSQRNVASFSPVLGGYYYSGTLYDEDTRGGWWGSTAYDGARRYLLTYDGSSLYIYGSYRRLGVYVRCVVKKNTKTLSNLTYMQDIAAISGVISCMYVKSVAVFSSLTQRM